MGKANSYLYLSRHNIYYFRVVIPLGVTGDVIKQEYRKSLQTRTPQIARKRCVALRACLEELYNGEKCVMVEWGELRKILDQKLLQLIAIEKKQVSKNGPYPQSSEDIWRDNAIPNYQKAIGDISKVLFGGGSTTPPDIAVKLAKPILKEKQINLPSSSDIFLKFCEATLNMYIEYHQQRLQINENARSFEMAPTGSTHTTTTALPTTQTMISDVIESYCDELKENNWNDKTLAEYQSLFRQFIEIVNDMPISSVDQHTAQHYKKALRKLPSNMKKKPQYRDKTIQQILDMTIPQGHRLSITRINDNIGRISTFFNWARKQGDVQHNYFENLKMKDKVTAQEKRLPFTAEDLKTIFSSEEYQAGKHKHPHYYWLPLIGLYSGARINEICQIHLEDIYEIDGVWVIDINDKGDKKVKSHASRRTTPIHRQLLQQGLINYVQKLTSKGEKRLFPELKKGRDGYSQSASRWFGRYKKRYGITDGRKVFHSFRHTLINQLKQKGVQREQIAAIVGHKDESITTGTYGEQYKPASLAPIIEMIEFQVNVPPYSW